MSSNIKVSIISPIPQAPVMIIPIGCNMPLRLRDPWDLLNTKAASLRPTPIRRFMVQATTRFLRRMENSISFTIATICPEACTGSTARSVSTR